MSLQIEVQRLSPAGAVVALRSLLGARRVEPVGDHAVRVTDAPERLRLARQVVAMLEASPDATASVTDPSNGDVIASLHLSHAKAGELVTALRSVLGVSSFAAFEDRDLVVVRDRPERVEAARALLRIVDEPCPCAEAGSG